MDGEFAPGVSGDLLAHHSRAESIGTVMPDEFLPASCEFEKLDDGVQVLIGATRPRQGGLPQLFGPSRSVPDRPQHLGHRVSPDNLPGGPAEQGTKHPDAFSLGTRKDFQQFRLAKTLPKQVAGVQVTKPGSQ